MIKFETLGMHEIAKINPVLTSDADVENYSFIVDGDITYLVDQSGCGDESRCGAFTIKAGDFLRGYDISQFVNQKFVIDLIHTDLALDDEEKDAPEADGILVINESTGALEAAAAAPESGFYFVITDLGLYLTGAAIKARLCLAGAAAADDGNG